MYGNFVVVESKGRTTTLPRVPLGHSPDRNEAWLRDTLFQNPEALPVDEIEPTFGPLVPLCTEMRTEAGVVDSVFVNSQGRITIMECKLWKNPQARREVVAQILDYVSAISAWGYADLQRQVAAATRRQGNVPFLEASARSNVPLNEIVFVDSVSRSLRGGSHPRLGRG